MLFRSVKIDYTIKKEDAHRAKSTSLAKKKRKTRKARKVSLNVSNNDAKAAVDEVIEKTEIGWRCKPCGRITTSQSNSNIRMNAEVHIDGLSFECSFCDNTFRSREMLHNHKRKHK